MGKQDSKRSRLEIQRPRVFPAFFDGISRNRVLKRTVLFCGIFLFSSVGVVSGNQADSSSAASVAQALDAPLAAATPSGTQPAPMDPRIAAGSSATNQAAPKASAACPLDLGGSISGDIRDIRGPVHIPDPFAWLLYAVVGLFFLFASVVLWRWVRRQRKEREKLPFEKALEQLERAKGFMKPESAGTFSVMVSEAIRNYIETRFNMEVTKNTTEEFMRCVKADSSGEIGEYQNLLNGFLVHCDLAKFARYALTVKQMEEMLRSALQFVDATRPRPEEQKTGLKVKDEESAADKKSTRKMPSLLHALRGKVFRFVPKRTHLPVSLEPGNAVAAGGR